jgi:hypothetical protein
MPSARVFILVPRHSRLIYDLMLRIFLCVALSCSGFCEMSAGREPEAAQTIQELEIGIQNKAPSTYFALATELFRSGYRFFVLAKAKTSEPSDEQAHFWLLSESVGQSIYENAGQRSATLLRALDRALAWDLEQPNGYTSKSAFGAEHERARQEMLALRERIKMDPNGLKRPLPSGRGLISW